LNSIGRLKERSAPAGGCVDIELPQQITCTGESNSSRQVRSGHEANQTCLTTAPRKKTATTASRIRPSRRFPARISSGVRLFCGFRVMLTFLDAALLRDDSAPLRSSRSAPALLSRSGLRRRLIRPSADFRTCGTEPGSARSTRGPLRHPTACRRPVRVRRRRDTPAARPRTGSTPARDRSRRRQS